MIELPIGVRLRAIVIEQRDLPAYEYVNAIDDVDDGLPWYHDIWNFVERGEFPAGATRKDRVALQQLAAQYIICGGKLYRRSHFWNEMPLLVLLENMGIEFPTCFTCC
ncbi:hypothetical protein RHMOL_Rhmol09G0104400 [Rhododendron molle]|uniref:Uncharacterized protein n=1 Tax=Rhododendron molle TaxID=49168 RepID=A0ACC0MBX2_RHOML|nr:hypothetical protein RHMOL_Rhmol09G0104400 [Rhododendron molle]